jgi:hypothetical protein
MIPFHKILFHSNALTTEGKYGFVKILGKG